jgi:hypothetical protein
MATIEHDRKKTNTWSNPNLIRTLSPEQSDNIAVGVMPSQPSKPTRPLRLPD